MWKQHLAQEAPKSLADKSQQGILREMRLETEQVYGHYFIMHYWSQSEADPRLFIKDCSFHILVLARREKEQSSVPLLVSGTFLWKVLLSLEVCRIDFSLVHSSCLWRSVKLTFRRKKIRLVDDAINFDDCKLSALTYVTSLQRKDLQDIMKLLRVWHCVMLFWIHIPLYSIYFCKTHLKEQIQVAIKLKG